MEESELGSKELLRQSVPNPAIYGWEVEPSGCSVTDPKESNPQLCLGRELPTSGVWEKLLFAYRLRWMEPKEPPDNSLV